MSWTVPSLSFSETIVVAGLDYAINAIRVKKLLSMYALKSGLELGLSTYVSNYLTYGRLQMGLIGVQVTSSVLTGLLYAGIRTALGNTKKKEKEGAIEESFKNNAIYGTLISGLVRMTTGQFVHPQLTKMVKDVNVNVMIPNSKIQVPTDQTTPMGIPFLANTQQPNTPAEATVSPDIVTFSSGMNSACDC